MSLDAVEGGGTVERTVQMSRHLVRSGVTCTVLATNIGWSSVRAKDLEGIEVVALPCVWKRYYLFGPAALRRIRDVITRADVVHLMGHWTLLNALTYLYARRIGKPYVVCPAGALPIFGRSRILKRLYNFVVGRRIVKHAARCIAVTRSELPHFKRYGVSGDKVTVIPNGIDLELFTATSDDNFRARIGLGADPFILFIGRLSLIKGPDLLLPAFAGLGPEFRRHHMVFVGPDDGMLSELRALAAASVVESRVHFVGYLGGGDKSCAYHAAELVVVPSRQEAMSIVVLEAGIAGKPVLLTDQCGFDEIARINGGLVVPASIDGLKQGLKVMLGDSEKLNVMGKDLQQFVRQRFDWTVIVNQYLELYQRIVGNTASSEIGRSP
jgi:glycosyltransferase involved in cell wall biosynthesis